MATKKKKKHLDLKNIKLVENKYNLKFSDLTKLEIVKLDEFKSKAWRNDVINAWCISRTIVPNPSDYHGTYDEDFWFGVYDSGKKEAYCTSYGGMCGYNFEEFYTDVDENPSLAEIDKALHSKILELLNNLLDSGIMIKTS